MASAAQLRALRRKYGLGEFRRKRKAHRRGRARRRTASQPSVARRTKFYPSFRPDVKSSQFSAGPKSAAESDL